MECRLCACNSERNLVDVFDERFSSGESVRVYVLLATGIDIRETDKITTRLCSSCINMSLQTYTFRKKALKTDRMLRKRAGQKNVCETVRFEDIVVRNDAIMNENKLVSDDFAEYMEDESVENMHSSVKAIFKEYPNLIFDKTLYEQNFDPKLTVDRLSLSNLLNIIQRSKRKRQSGSSKNVHKIIESKKPTVNVEKPINFKSPSEKEQEIQEHKNRDEQVIKTEPDDSCKMEIAEDEFHIKPEEDEITSQSLQDFVTIKSEPEYSCDLCSATFSDRVLLSLHEEIHNTCTHCSKILNNRDGLKEHLRASCPGLHLPFLQNVFLKHRLTKPPKVIARTDAFEIHDFYDTVTKSDMLPVDLVKNECYSVKVLDKFEQPKYVIEDYSCLIPKDVVQPKDSQANLFVMSPVNQHIFVKLPHLAGTKTVQLRVIKSADNVDRILLRPVNDPSNGNNTKQNISEVRQRYNSILGTSLSGPTQASSNNKK